MILKNDCIDSFKEKLKNHFFYPFTEDQNNLLEESISFLKNEKINPLLIITGFAGTGKSSFLGALVKSLKEINVKTCLLGPTGRSSKVLSAYSDANAFTIHRKIYFHSKQKNGSYKSSLAPNKHKNTLFIIDECSMIPKNKLLDDILSYVFNGINCQLIFIGDPGQLPPIGESLSPALDKRYLQRNHPSLSISHVHLNQIVRQKQSSGILYNANRVRNNNTFNKIKTNSFNDIQSLNGSELQAELENSYQEVGEEETIIITRSNKRANNYNSHIRKELFWRESPIEKNDLIMAIKNNYFWTENEENSFIANGEFFEVIKFIKEEIIYNTVFLRAKINLNNTIKEILIFKKSIEIEKASLDFDFQNTLYKEIEKDFLYMRNKKDRSKAILTNSYYNALQVKFGYAITGHKSQGGQWKHVYIDLGYITPEHLDENFKRWLYTAMSRAKEKLFLINFPDFLLSK